MTYTEVTGDLFDLDLPAIGHGVNCKGLMGAGIAKTVRSRYPGMFLAYQRRCRLGRLTLGQVMAWPASRDHKIIYNLATQDHPGPYADLGAIRQTVRWMLDDAHRRGIDRVGIPRIGAGIGGLAWEDVKSTLHAVAAPSPVELVVVTLPGA